MRMLGVGEVNAGRTTVTVDVPGSTLISISRWADVGRGGVSVTSSRKCSSPLSSLNMAGPSASEFSSSSSESWNNFVGAAAAAISFERFLNSCLAFSASEGGGDSNAVSSFNDLLVQRESVELEGEVIKLMKSSTSN